MHAKPTIQISEQKGTKTLGCKMHARILFGTKCEWKRSLPVSHFVCFCLEFPEPNRMTYGRLHPENVTFPELLPSNVRRTRLINVTGTCLNRVLLLKIATFWGEREKKKMAKMYQVL